MPIMAIKGFFGEFRFLSNFWPAPIVVQRIQFPTVEHAYQALKSTNRADWERIAKLPSPRDAKAAGYKLTVRPGWDKHRVFVMSQLLKLKFAIPELRKALLMTDDAYLEETNTWGDQFWGVCDGVGENHLGKLLMQVRSEILLEHAS
jgi:hypothetical protein